MRRWLASGVRQDLPGLARQVARSVDEGHGGRETGYCTLGRAPTPTARAEGRRRTLQAIHVPLITTSTAPTSTVGGVLAGPIVAAYTRLKYISTCAAAHRAPAHLGSVPERQTATPRSTLPASRSTMSSRPVSANTVFAKMGAAPQILLGLPTQPAPPLAQRR
jgi:hypothetical protein